MSPMQENLRTRVPSFSQMTALGVAARSTYVDSNQSLDMPSSIEVEGGGAGATVQTTIGQFGKTKQGSIEHKRKLSEIAKARGYRPPSRKGIRHTPEARKKISEASLRNWARADYRENWIEKHSGENHHFYGMTFSEEYRKKISEAHSEQIAWNKGLELPHLRGENSARWKGGISFEPYCLKFNEPLKERVRNEFGRVCQMCGKSALFNGRRLSVHHIDGNKMQGCDSPWLLTILCVACHSRVTAARGQREIELEFLLATRSAVGGRSVR